MFPFYMGYLAASPFHMLICPFFLCDIFMTNRSHLDLSLPLCYSFSFTGTTFLWILSSLSITSCPCCCTPLLVEYLPKHTCQTCLLTKKKKLFIKRNMELVDVDSFYIIHINLNTKQIFCDDNTL